LLEKGSASGISAHTWQAFAADWTTIGKKWMLALSAADLFTSLYVLAKTKEEFDALRVEGMSMRLCWEIGYRIWIVGGGR